MKGIAGLLGGLVALASAHSVAAAATKVWICQDQQGVRGAQDRPCDENEATLRAPAGMAAPAQRKPSIEATAEAARSRSDSRFVGAPPAHSPTPRDSSAVTSNLGGSLFPLAGLALLVGVLSVAAGAGKLWLVGLVRRQTDRALKAAVRRTKETFLSRSSANSPRAAIADERVATRAAPTLNYDLGPDKWTLQLLRDLEWRRFEDVCCGYWKAKGYDASLTGPGADGGIDVVLKAPSDPVRVFGVIQCKSWNSRKVGVEQVRVLPPVEN